MVTHEQPLALRALTQWRRFVVLGTIGAVLCLLFTTGCASDRTSELIDKQLDIYRYEQEKLRNVDLKKAYAEEEAQAKALEAKILSLKKELAKRRAELGRLEKEKADLLEKGKGDAEGDDGR